MSDAEVAWPTVSVVMPIRNEAEGLAAAVSSVLGQQYPGELDLHLAVAPSDDGTESVAVALTEADPRVHVIPNPSGRTPAGLNAAISASRGEVVVRVDGHARLDDGYVRQAVETMGRTGAVNVGGVQRAVGRTPFEQAVAIAMTSWMGTGGSRFHVGGDEGPVDTVYLGVFRREALEGVGGFDERLVRNQDYELNIRLRAAGGTIWFDPDLGVEYRPRSTWRGLARQYFEYGWWKADVARQHPGSLRPRQVAPVVLTIALAASLAPGRRGPLRWLPLAYLGATTVVAARQGASSRGVATHLAVVLPTMHVAWGTGFLASVVTSARMSIRARVARRG